MWEGLLIGLTDTTMNRKKKQLKENYQRDMWYSNQNFFFNERKIGYQESNIHRLKISDSDISSKTGTISKKF